MPDKCHLGVDIVEADPDAVVAVVVEMVDDPGKLHSVLNGGQVAAHTFADSLSFGPGAELFRWREVVAGVAESDGKCRRWWRRCIHRLANHRLWHLAHEVLWRQAAVVAPLAELNAVDCAPASVAVASHADAVSFARGTAGTTVWLRAVPWSLGPCVGSSIVPDEGAFGVDVVEADPDAVVAVVVEVSNDPVELFCGGNGGEVAANGLADVTSLKPGPELLNRREGHLLRHVRDERDRVRDGATELRGHDVGLADGREQLAKLVLEPDQRALVPMYVCIHVCMYVCMYV